jgi:hypothetical protein
MTGFYEHNTEPLGSIKQQEFLDHLGDHQLLSKDSLFHGVGYFVKIFLFCILNDITMLMGHSKLYVTIPSVTAFALLDWRDIIFGAFTTKHGKNVPLPLLCLLVCK